ncbi:MAG TPA: hypothetical protein VMG10_17645 [Gemmataceae bacterium]|nr:hypothetical protein [Gemmataceae bacterium]
MVTPATLTAELKYCWRPFLVGGQHLSFVEHKSARLKRRLCSCWGPAIYKWEGIFRSGAHAGKTGVLIGETGDLRQRIKQCVSGTQERGNKLWRITFLSVSDAKLYTLHLDSFVVGDREPMLTEQALRSNNVRLIL